MTHRDPDENGWHSSANVWIDRMQDGGDFARRYVLDTPMLAYALAAAPASALDVGCGEGRFCRMLRDNGISATGVDPVEAFVARAQAQDPEGHYVSGFAEALPFEADRFDLVVSYLTLIDIDGLEEAVAEMARVTRPGGRILIANLTSFATSSAAMGKRVCRDSGETLRPLGPYLDVRQDWYTWDGLRVQNWHRPLSDYMQAFLTAGLVLTRFDEPKPRGGPKDRLEGYRAMPFLMMMEWEKPAP